MTIREQAARGRTVLVVLGLCVLCSAAARCGLPAAGAPALPDGPGGGSATRRAGPIGGYKQAIPTGAGHTAPVGSALPPGGPPIPGIR